MTKEQLNEAISILDEELNRGYITQKQWHFEYQLLCDEIAGQLVKEEFNSGE
jgi:hypothetical protein